MASLNVVITGVGFGFPDGAGATARVMSVAKGLMRHGATVRVLVPKPSENETTGLKNLAMAGEHDGIAFEYTCGRRLAAKTRLGAALLYLRGLARARQIIRRLHRKQPVDAILLWYPEDLLNFAAFRTLATSLGTLLIAEKSELPFVYTTRSSFIRMVDWLGHRIVYPQLDGIIAISSFLYNYFVELLRDPARILQVPILVETAQFGKVQAPRSSAAHTIIYCGNLYHEGEVEGLLRAFATLVCDFPSWRLCVIGDDSDTKRRVSLQSLVAALGLKDHVEFLGQRARREIPSLLADGDIMALPREGALFSTAGFPTKLGEYLASGKPVVVTGTGDIPQYLEHGASAYLVPPGDDVAFAEALRHAMRHPNEAAEVGRRGREVAIREFDTFTNCRKIIDFINARKAARRDAQQR